jgi:hypothetical protein
LTGTKTEGDFSNQELDAGDAVLIAKDIRDNGRITSLDVSHKEQCTERFMHADSRVGILLLATAIRANQTLVELNMSNNYLSNQGFTHLGHGLRNHKTLNELNISGCSNTRSDISGIFEIIDVISTMETLMKLDISNNHLCPEGTCYLGTALKGNKSITELNISSNRIRRNQQGLYEDTSGLLTITKTIVTMKGFKSLDIRYNLKYDNLGEIAAMIKAHAIMHSTPFILIGCDHVHERLIIEKVKDLNAWRIVTNRFLTCKVGQAGSQASLLLAYRRHGGAAEQSTHAPTADLCKGLLHRASLLHISRYL